MSSNLIFALQLSIGLPALLAVIRFRRVDGAYYPFLCLLLLRLSQVGMQLLLKGQADALNLVNAIYALLEIPLLLVQFRRWGLFRKLTETYHALFAEMAALWFAEFALRKFSGPLPFFTIGASVLLLICLVHLLSRVAFELGTPLYRHPVMLAGLGLLAGAVYGLLIALFGLYGLQADAAFLGLTKSVWAVVNALSNLVFSTAIIWIPLRRRYLLRS